eukprot:s992_g4.t1
MCKLRLDFFQLAEARPRWPLQFDWPDCLFASNFDQTLRPSLESSVSYKPTMSDQVERKQRRKDTQRQNERKGRQEEDDEDEDEDEGEEEDDDGGGG